MPVPGLVPVPGLAGSVLTTTAAPAVITSVAATILPGRS